MSLLPGGAYFKHDPARLEIEGTDKPWVFRSGLRGLRQCTIPLAEPVDGRARYTVRLSFCELDNDAPGKRVFDIKLQGKVVAEGFDVFKEAGKKNRAVVKEFTGIDADDALKLEFVPRTTGSEPDRLPILQGIEVEREKVLTLGLGAPTFLLNDAEPEREGELLIVNNKSEDFAGTLLIESPEGFTVAPNKARLKIPSGERAAVNLKAAVAGVASAPHCALRKSFHFWSPSVPAVFAAWYLALHSCAVSALTCEVIASAARPDIAIAPSILA